MTDGGIKSAANETSNYYFHLLVRHNFRIAHTNFNFIQDLNINYIKFSINAGETLATLNCLH